MKKIIIQIKKDKGYTLLFAVLVSSLVLAIGISILTISKKEFLLSSSARDSAISLYAADSGIECAAYGDYAYDSFATSTPGTTSLVCGEAYSPVSAAVENPTGVWKRTLSVKFGNVGASCATITVTKDYAGTSPRTTIDSRGYNIGWNEANNTCDVPSVKKVERSFLLSY